MNTPPERRVSLRASLRQQSKSSPMSTPTLTGDEAPESSPSPAAVARPSSRRRSSSRREMELASPVLLAPLPLQDSPSPPPPASSLQLGDASPEPNAFDPAVALGSLMYTNQVPSPTQAQPAAATAAAATTAHNTAAAAPWGAAMPAVATVGSNPGASLFSVSSASASPPAPLPLSSSLPSAAPLHLSSSFDPAMMAAFQSAQQYGYPFYFPQQQQQQQYAPHPPFPAPLPLGSQQLQSVQSAGQHQLSPPLLPPPTDAQQQAFYTAAAAAASQRQFMPPFPGQPQQQLPPQFYSYPPHLQQQQNTYPFPQQPLHPLPHFPHPIAHAPPAAAHGQSHAHAQPHPRAHHPHTHLAAGASVVSGIGSMHAHASTPLPILTPWLLDNHRAGVASGSVLPPPEAFVDLHALRQMMEGAQAGGEEGEAEGGDEAEMEARASAAMSAFQTSLAAVLSNNARRGCGMLVLPRTDLAAPIEFVSAKQHRRLVHRMHTRAVKRAQSAFHASGARKHHSRQLHAIRRVRGKGGRFLTKEEKEAMMANMQQQQQQMGSGDAHHHEAGFAHELTMAGLEQEEMDDGDEEE